MSDLLCNSCTRLTVYDVKKKIIKYDDVFVFGPLQPKSQILHKTKDFVEVVRSHNWVEA